MIEDKKGLFEICNVKPPIRPMARTRRSLYMFFLIYFITHIITYFTVFPCKIRIFRGLYMNLFRLRYRMVGDILCTFRYFDNDFYDACLA